MSNFFALVSWVGQAVLVVMGVIIVLVALFGVAVAIDPSVGSILPGN